MNELYSNSQSELRIPPKPVIAILPILGWLLTTLRDLLPDPLKVMDLTLFIYALSAVAWVLANWKPRIARWFTILAWVAVVLLLNAWLAVPESLALMLIPTGLATALIGLPAAFVTAIGETTLLVLLPNTVAMGADGTTIAVALAAVWATLGTVYAVYRPARQAAEQSWKYYQRAQGSLEEARDRKAELEQALEDLAHANRQLALANERMAALRQIAEEAQKTKTAFVAKVSHEFRTPLNMIIGLIDLLVETPEVYGEELPPALFEDLKIVHRNCEHLSSMISDVLDLSQVETGRLTLHRERVDLAEVIDRALAAVRPLLEKKSLGLQVVIPQDLSEIYCDRTRIRQVILNLVSNAARFTEEGSITIHVTEQAQHVVVSVTDTGPGISRQDAERIFEPFCQGANTLWRDKSGTGLGLSISKQFVELHGGRIWLESEPGAGTTFSFELPVSVPIGHATGPGRWIKEDWVWVERASRAHLPNSSHKPRVVICDATGDLHPAFVRYSDEVELVGTENLAEAIQELGRCPAHAVVVNAPSPENLWPLVERTRLEIPDTPVMGCSVPPRVARALESGAAAYLIKPVTRADLEEAIQAVGKPVNRVLVVDDEPDVLQLLTRMLYACDGTLEVTTASDGRQALDELRSRPPDLVLLDIMMPDIDGWQVIESMGRDQTTRDVPVIVVSAQDPTEQPMASPVLLATMGEGLSLSQLLRCSLEMSSLLLGPGRGPDPVPV